MACSILALPHEILFQVLCRLDYASLTAFSRTCRDARSFASRNNQLLWQAIFLQLFDDPRNRWSSLTKTARAHNQAQADNWDWYVELRRRVIALRHIKAGGDLPLEDSMTDEPGNTGRIWEETIETLLDIVETAKSEPSPEEIARGKKPELDDRDLSQNLRGLPLNYNLTAEVDGLIRGLPACIIRKNSSAPFFGGDTLGASGMPGAWNTRSIRPGTTARQQAALELDKLFRSENASKLHVLCGLTEYEERDDDAIARARRIVYDWDATDAKNEFGPFKKDGSGMVDWRRLEAVMTVVARQFGLAVRGRMILPQGFCFSLPFRTLTDPTVPEDWARCQGLWCGTYVFLHWDDLVQFNAIQNTATRPILENGSEACGGLMKLELKLDMKLKDDRKLHTSMPICDDLPMLYFSGVSRSYDFAMATGVRGMCCLAPGGKEVRWRYIVSYSGFDQWQLEGVQPGGIRSGCVYGTWTSCAHEDGGPVGPFIYAPEELCKPTSVVLVS